MPYSPLLGYEKNLLSSTFFSFGPLIDSGHGSCILFSVGELHQQTTESYLLL